MLAQTTQKSSRDIRGLVGASRQQASAGAGEVGAVRETLARLGLHLENLSTEADSIAGALGEGAGAIGRLEGAVTTLGDAAAGALALPARQKQRVAGGG
jgi:methyl-accepting chemotaxis protein